MSTVEVGDAVGADRSFGWEAGRDGVEVVVGAAVVEEGAVGVEDFPEAGEVLEAAEQVAAGEVRYGN